MNDLVGDLTKEMEKDLGVKLPPRASNGPKPEPVPTHAERIDALIEEFRMTIRILEEAKRRL